jgi:signal transduction histidine kinase
MGRRSSLLRRLFLDAVLPVTLAALALVVALSLQVTRNQRDRLDAQVESQIEQLSNALAGGAVDSPQPLLDRAVREGGLLRAELRQSDGREWSYGTTAGGLSVADYRRDLQAIDGSGMTLQVQADLGPLHRAQAITWIFGALSAAGIALLAWLAQWSLRQQVVQPLLQVRSALDASLQDHVLPLASPPATEDFDEVRQALARLSGRVAQHQHPVALDPGESQPGDDEALRQHQAANRSKARFIALVNHHFRQPLQALQLFAANLQHAADPDQQALQQHMRTSIGAMTRLLDALLEISRLDAGVVAVKPVEFSAAELFMHDRSRLSEGAARNGVVLIWRGSQLRLHGDADLAAGLLLQLASNAIANAPWGRVLIAARPRGDTVRIEVRDNGPGIAPEQQQSIFEEFVQLPGSDNQRRDGYGLGLAIGDRVARLLGTRIGLRSAPGRGSTFWFDLPRSPVAERRRTPRGRSSASVWRHTG